MVQDVCQSTVCNLFIYFTWIEMVNWLKITEKMLARMRDPKLRRSWTTVSNNIPNLIKPKSQNELYISKKTPFLGRKHAVSLICHVLKLGFSTAKLSTQKMTSIWFLAALGSEPTHLHHLQWKKIRYWRQILKSYLKAKIDGTNTTSIFQLLCPPRNLTNRPTGY